MSRAPSHDTGVALVCPTSSIVFRPSCGEAQPKVESKSGLERGPAEMNILGQYPCVGQNVYPQVDLDLEPSPLDCPFHRAYQICFWGAPPRGVPQCNVLGGGGLGGGQRGLEKV